MLNYDILIGILMIAAIVLFVTYLVPIIRKRGRDNIYNDVKLALLLFGYAFRDEKIIAITAALYKIVEETERLHIANEDKLEEAVSLAFVSLLNEFNILLEEEVIEVLVNIAVAYLPATKKTLD